MLIFDELDSRNKIGQEFESKLKQTRKLRLLSPYISSGSWNPQELFKTNRQLEHIDILCDLKNPACNPKTVRELSGDERISIKYMDKIHAKVYIFDNTVLVASANFTPNGMGEGLIEAGSVEENVKCAERWYNSLWEKAEWVPDVNDEIKWNELESRWKIARAHKKDISLTEIEKPHILDLLQSSENFENIIFCLWYDDENNIKTTEKDIINEFGDLNELPSEKWDFYWEGEADGRSQDKFNEVDEICKRSDEKIWVNIKINKSDSMPSKKQSFFLASSMKKRVWGRYSDGKTEICSLYQYVDGVDIFTLANKRKERLLIDMICEKLKQKECATQWEKWKNEDLGYVSFSDMQKFLGFDKKEK